MRKKIAFISGWYNFGGNNGISEDYRFMTNCLYDSAKKYFLPNHDVEFIFITNGEFTINGVTNIKIDQKIDGFWEMCLMKILSLKVVENKYDYIFVNDNDQIYIKEVGDEILESDFTFLDHYFAPPVKGIHEEITDIVELNFNTSEEKWTMGNFFGGKQKNMLELLSLTEENHKKYFGHNYNQNHFYSRYPEELFIIKYVFENNINHKRLNCCFNPLDTTSEVFLGDFSVKESDHFKIKNTKLLHGTKQNLNKLKDYMIENKKIVVCQFYTPNISYGKFSEKINQKYCEDNGYDYYVEKDGDKIKNKIGSRAWTWYKPLLIEEVFNSYPDCEYVLFIDIDAIFCNNNRRIEEFITNDFSILMTKDYGPSLVNAGVMLIKNNQFSKDFIKNWWNICEEFPQYKQGLWHDQTCIGLLHERLTTPQEFKIIDNLDFNSIGYGDNKFIFHAFAFGNLLNRTIDSIYYKKFDIPIPTGTQLLDIIQYYSTDKHHEHNFFNLVYNELFKDIYLDVKTFIEIGVSDGESIKLWRDYFVNSEIIGFENNLPYSFERLGDTSRERMTFIDGDQSNEEDLIKFSETYSNVDVILDDGSHKMRDQQITLSKLFKMLKSDGIYILEDLHTSFEAVMPEKSWCGWGDSSKTITLNMLQLFKETGKIESDYMTQDDMDYLSENIKSVEIYKNRPDWSVTSVIIKK
jgi:hypothetical protein